MAQNLIKGTKQDKLLNQSRDTPGIRTTGAGAKDGVTLRAAEWAERDSIGWHAYQLAPLDSGACQQLDTLAGMMRVDFGTRTDIGRRDANEDVAGAEFPVFLVADGMGGHASGGVASAIVVEELSPPTGQDRVTQDWVADAFDRAHSRVRADADGGGTTVAGMAVVDESGTPYWLVFNIGDSRVYLLTADAIRRLTVDHSLVQEMVDNGELPMSSARRHPQRHIITRAIGSVDDSRVDYWLVPINLGDRILICTDGITAELSDESIAAISSLALGPQSVADLLVETAIQRGGTDNATAVVVDVVELTQTGYPNLDAALPHLRGEAPTDTQPRRRVEPEEMLS